MATSKINPKYKATIEQIKIDSENKSEKRMQDIYKLQNDKLDAVHSMVGMVFIKHGTNGVLNVNGKAKITMMNEFNTNLTKMAKDLGSAEVDKVSSILRDTYKDTYYTNAYVMGQFGIKTNFKILKQQFVDRTINAEYKESTFSDRIWTNKESMISNLKQALIDANDGNTSINDIAQNISNIFGVQAYQGRRLVRTEVARNSANSQLQIGLDSNCTQVQWSATLDDKTEEYDASLDGQTWGINDDHPMPVESTHPNCRCVLLNVPYDGWQPTQRMDNNTKELIDYKSYSDWKADNGIDSTDNTDDTTN